MLELLVVLGLVGEDQAKAVARGFCDRDSGTAYDSYPQFAWAAEAAAKAAAARYGTAAQETAMYYYGIEEWCGLDGIVAYVHGAGSPSDVAAVRAAYAAYHACRKRQLEAVRGLVTPRQILDALATV